MGSYSREVGYPKRYFISTNQELVDFINKSISFKSPCFMSVQPYHHRDCVLGIEKVFFDFDSISYIPDLDKTLLEAESFAEHLKFQFNLESFIVFSGRKGYHLYVFLKDFLEFKPDEERLCKIFYELLQKKLLPEKPYETLDEHPIGNIKALSRIPYTPHESGKLCSPIGVVSPENILSFYRNNGISRDFVNPILEEAKVQIEKLQLKPEKPSFIPKNTKVRICFREALKSSTIPHKMRLGIASEYLKAGYNSNQVVDLFQHMSDFDRRKSLYFVEHAQRRGYTPLKCETIMKYGFCLKMRCGIYRKREILRFRELAKK